MKNNPFSGTFLQQGFPALVLVAALACAQGCAHYQVRIPDIDELEKPYRGGTMHAYFWGFWVNPQVMAAKCQDEAINDVVITRTYLHDLASVLTLGIWMPVEVHFRCRAPDIDEGAFPE